MEAQTKVIFRKWRNGDILALFPQIAADVAGLLCSSYEHCGQHGAADYFHCIQHTKPALLADFTNLQDELETIGYSLTVSKKATRHDHLLCRGIYN